MSNIMKPSMKMNKKQLISFKKNQKKIWISLILNCGKKITMQLYQILFTNHIKCYLYIKKKNI